MVVRELRKLSNEARRATKIAARTADESLKWLEWSQLLTARLTSNESLPSRCLWAFCFISTSSLRHISSLHC